MVALLERESVPYCLIGALAVSLYVEPRATEDVDFVVVLPGRKSLEVLFHELDRRDISYQYRQADPFDPLGDVIRILVPEKGEGPVVPVDVRVAKYRYEAEFIRSAALLHFAGIDLKVIRREDLVCLKRKAGSPKDLLDVYRLSLAGPGHLNYQYIGQRCAEMGLPADALEVALRRVEALGIPLAGPISGGLPGGSQLW